MIKKITCLCVLAVLLVSAFIWGGNSKSLHEPNVKQVKTEQKAKKNNVIEKPDNNTENIPKQEKKKDAPAVNDEIKIAAETEPETPPMPAEDTENADKISEPDKKFICTLTVRCDTILNNMSQLDEAKAEIIPSDGIIYAERESEFSEGESVFDVLVREMRENGIHLEFENIPIYKSAYINGINNIYEFDCGELSGWMYRVNGEYPQIGCSRYILKNGDRVEWLYTCELGKDIDGYCRSEGE